MLEAFGLSDPGCVRQNNEDFYLISPTGVYIVADGMGGAQAGEHASKLAVETVASFLQNAASAGRRDSLSGVSRGQSASDEGGGRAIRNWRAWGPLWWRRSSPDPNC